MITVSYVSVRAIAGRRTGLTAGAHHAQLVGGLFSLGDLDSSQLGFLLGDTVLQNRGIRLGSGHLLAVGARLWQPVRLIVGSIALLRPRSGEMVADGGK